MTTLTADADRADRLANQVSADASCFQLRPRTASSLAAAGVFSQRLTDIKQSPAAGVSNDE